MIYQNKYHLLMIIIHSRGNINNNININTNGNSNNFINYINNHNINYLLLPPFQNQQQQQ